jgi:membrane protein implicated in regulation of membrane protease activity
LNRGSAIWATVLALALINIGLAATIVALMRTSNFAPLWLGLLLVAAGVIALVMAVRRWQRYLHEVRTRPAEARRG